MTKEQFKKKYPREYDRLSYRYFILMHQGGLSAMGGDLAEWLSIEARVPIRIAKLFVDLFAYY